jgi:uncharacterized repeat protein (TIGR03803 family)
MKNIGLGKILCMVAAFCVTTAAASNTQTFNVVARFGQKTGYALSSPLVQGTDGNFYGTANVGGSNQSAQYCNNGSCGTVFRVTPSGKLTTLYNFCSETNCADGGLPLAALVLGANGNFYGTTSTGGANNGDSGGICDNMGCGTVFEITPSGKLTTIHNFCAQTNCTDGVFANQLVLGFNGNLYGTTESGGTVAGGDCESGCGTAFEITPSGKFTTLYTFCTEFYQNGNCANGMIPTAALIQATNGNFYGTTLYGGENGAGDIFEITPGGKFKEIYSFCSQANCADGLLRIQDGFLVQTADANFYGTTGSGGANGGGTFFTVTLTGELTTLYNFCYSTSDPCPDGSNPGSVSLGTDGNFYGTTTAGGNDVPTFCGGPPFGCGTAFEMSPSGQLTTLHTFCSQANCGDGATNSDGYQGVIQATNGTFYGLTDFGGRPEACGGIGCGTVFSIDMGLGPFVTANPNGGEAGRFVKILGNNLTGTTSVTFNGVAATFDVVSDTYIKATVPSGATTGSIVVTTPTGTLSSNAAFQVLP